MALELSERTWKVLFASPAGRRRERSVAARDVAALVGEIAAPGIGCGRDGRLSAARVEQKNEARE